MTFLILLLVAGIAYLVWRIADQLPDLIFRISEMQRDVAELRRTLADGHGRAESVAPPPVRDTHGHAAMSDPRVE
jgi:hypothetical protein